MGEILKNLSKCLFSIFFKENMYGYVERRFSSIVHKYLSNSEPLLDAACGLNNVYLNGRDLKCSFGVDIDPNVKIKNKIHKKFIIQDLHKPLPNEKFKTIISIYTFEHLVDSSKVLTNFKEVLANDGSIIIVAPIDMYYISILERLTPKFIKNLSWKILKGKKRMPYPAYFSLCNKHDLHDYADKLNLKIVDFETVCAPPIWFSRIPPLFILALIPMIILNTFSFLSNYRSTFIAILQNK